MPEQGARAGWTHLVAQPPPLGRAVRAGRKVGVEGHADADALGVGGAEHAVVTCQALEATDTVEGRLGARPGDQEHLGSVGV